MTASFPPLMRSPTSLRAALALGLVVAFGLLAAGCGGDDDDSDTGGSSEPLTKTEFIDQADTICSETNAQTQEEVSEFLDGGSPTAENLPDVAEFVASGIQDQVSGIRGLTPPEGDEEEIDAILTKADEGAEAIRENPDSLSGSGVANPSLDEANELAVAFGLQVCGNDDG